MWTVNCRPTAALPSSNGWRRIRTMQPASLRGGCRRTQFALLRVLGVTRRRLVWLIVSEGASLGIAGSLLGLIVGFALASLAVQWSGADLGSGYFRGVMPEVDLDLPMLLVFFAVGVAVSGPCERPEARRSRGRLPESRS